MHVIDALNHKEIKTITLPKGFRPMCVKLAQDGLKVYASTGRAGNICVLSPVTGEVLNTIKVGARPWGIVLSPDGKFLFSANGPSNDISVVDLGAEKEIKRIPAGESPWGVAIVLRD
jgi:YVTN family beta-propeller protein